MIIGARDTASGIACEKVTMENVHEFSKKATALGLDPLGERGEYHTQVVRVLPLGVSIDYKCASFRVEGGYILAELT